MVVSADSFEQAIKKLLAEYDDEVNETLKEVIPEVAKEGAKKLKDTSPRNETSKKKRKYYRGWAVQLEEGRMVTKATIYGKTGTYQLAHLLEFGHVTKNGKDRVYPRTPAHPHIADVEAWVQDEAPRRTIERLER